MINIDCDITKYCSTEEFFAFFMHTHNLGKSILYSNLVKANHLFEHLESNNYFDSYYINKLKESFGSYFVGEKNSHAIFDANLIINFISNRETNMKKEDIEKFFLYHISIICTKDTYAKKDLLKDMCEYYFKNSSEPFNYKTIIELTPIPNEIKNLKISYINAENILENIEALEALLDKKDEVSLNLINNIKKMLK